jgi:hypothetical protein
MRWIPFLRWTSPKSEFAFMARKHWLARMLGQAFLQANRGAVGTRGIFLGSRLCVLGALGVREAELDLITSSFRTQGLQRLNSKLQLSARDGAGFHWALWAETSRQGR